MRAGALALLALLIPALIPAAAQACPMPPHEASTFRFQSFAALPGCAGQWVWGCLGPGVTAAWYELPTDRYAHGVLGDAIEGGRLSVYSEDKAASSCGTKMLTLDPDHVFEDTRPRLVDLDGDGWVEIITVRSHRAKGAQLAIYREVPGKFELELAAQTPYIGQPNRWLAPIAVADLDGDGSVEIAYIDRPHLAKTLRIWRYRDSTLSEVASIKGLTNHKIGWDFIAGGLRACSGHAPELITADASWQRIIATRFDGTTLHARDLGPYTGPDSLTAATNCG